jgi:para-aminobenzoate synthetase/4-amino-4-deoxychorismate lyase
MLTQKEIISLLKSHPPKEPFVFLETATFDEENKNSFLFKDFTKIITFYYNDDIDFFFRQIEDALKKKSWLCGYFAYEFGYFLEPALAGLRKNYGFPLAWIGACKKPCRIPGNICNADINENNPSYSIENIKPSLNLQQYSLQIAKIKNYLKQGLTYQVNFTFKVKFDFSGKIFDFYSVLKRAQPTSYMALMNTGKESILSFSPELFFRIAKNKIIVRPMKGTAARGLLERDDEKNKAWLASDSKIKAENLMIVDLLRNDLGKISKKVWVPKLFAVERYRTLYQMTSTVEAQLKRHNTVKEIFSALFPSGSVTGAPKIKTMQLIKNLEKEPRSIYTGAIGFISPKREMCFNVAIRTVSIAGNKGQMGVGGGIVYDSSAPGEYAEALLKSKFLMQEFPKFSLIETMLWQKDKGYFLLDEHLKRLEKSSIYFSIPLELNKIRKALEALKNKLKGEEFKIRILASASGLLKIESAPLEDIKQPVKLKLSRCRINPQDVFLYHKTTQRKLYDEELEKARKEGFFEAIFLNIYDEITEGSISNIFIKKAGTLYTPPLKCGLLPGILRKKLIKEGRSKERIIKIKDLLRAENIYIGNSVRGLLSAQIFLADLENSSKIKTLQ